MIGDQKNLILAIVISVAILMLYQTLVEMPRRERQQAEQAEQAKLAETQSPVPSPGGAPGTVGAKPAVDGTAPAVSGAAPQLGVDTSEFVGAAGDSPGERRAAALKLSPRLAIVSPRLEGSIALKGARFDDLFLKNYRVSIEPDSPDVEFLRPNGAENPYYAEFGWIGEKSLRTPNSGTVWTADSRRLEPGNPVTLRWDNGQGLLFERRIELDNDYMFTVTQRVRNTGDTPVQLAPYGLISRTSKPDILGFYILHEGLIGVFDSTLTEVDYDDLVETDPKRYQAQRYTSTGGWLGITDKYWLAALIPDQKEPMRASFNAGGRNKQDKYQSDYLLDSREIAVGATVTVTNRFFAGAKQVPLLDRYEKEFGIDRFDLAVDFGWFYFLTKPIFLALLWIEKHVGNLGLSILVLTVFIKLLFFPLANKSYRSMSRMKALQPKMQEMKERFGDDRQRLNQAMMELYKKEKVNPAAGCLPMVIQIPVFFALYKVLFVTIEMRHAPFYGWIHDLSARDPLGILGLFGLVDWNIPAMLDVVNIGIWPIIMGLTMFMQQRLNPQPTDPIQAKVFLFMPLFFTFLLAPFPAGLVIYWAWNNILSIAQQWVIMKRMGVK
jgi:YidC/Oxa1 family membrane protein insertase